MLINSGHVVVQLSLMVFIVVLASSCSPDLLERVRVYEATYNAHDVENLMSFYADDIKFEIVGLWVKNGKTAVRELAEWDRATNMHMAISDIKVSGDSVTFKLVETNDWWRLVGIGEICYEPSVMIFRNGLISEIRATMTQESLDAHAKAWPSIISWAKEHRGEELKELLPGGTFVYGAVAAKKWIVLLQEWRAAQEP